MSDSPRLYDEGRIGYHSLERSSISIVFTYMCIYMYMLSTYKYINSIYYIFFGFFRMFSFIFE